MMRSFVFVMCCLTATACRDDSVDRVTPASPRLVEISLGDSGDRLTFMLPDAWHRDEATAGLAYARDDLRLRVGFCLKESEYVACVARSRAEEAGAEVRAFEIGQVWPFVGVVVAYRGPPDAPMLDAFVRSFTFERR